MQSASARSRAQRRNRRRRRAYMLPVIGTPTNTRKRPTRNWWRIYLPSLATRKHRGELKG